MIFTQLFWRTKKMNQIKTPSIYEECKLEGFGTIFASQYDSNNYQFNDVHDMILEKSDEIITFRDLGIFRLNFGINHSVSMNSSYVNQRVLFLPREKINTYWLNLNPEEHKFISDNMELSRRNEPFLKRDVSQLKHFLNTLPEDRYLPVSDLSNIDVKNMHKDNRAKFILDDIVEPIQELLLKNSIYSLPINMNTKEYIDSMSKPFSNMLWFLGFDRNFAISCGPDYTNQRMIRGLKKSATEPEVKTSSNLIMINEDIHTHYF